MRLVLSKNKPKDELKIKDLTKGKYKSIIGYDNEYNDKINDLDGIISNLFFNQKGEDIKKELCKIPIYFVDRLQSNTVVDNVELAPEKKTKK